MSKHLGAGFLENDQLYMMQEEDRGAGHLGDNGALWNRHCLSGVDQHKPGDLQSPVIRRVIIVIILHELYIDTGYIGVPCESGLW